jgi:flagellar basal-body rod modification protein FlgD
MVSDVSISGALGQQANTAASTDKLAEDFSQFLNLLTVQLQNQDPLSPMDTTEFTNQLVAFTGVEQQINTNQKLDSLVALNLGTSFSQSQNYVGQEISYVSSEFDYAGGSTSLRYSLNEEASLSKINIVDENGAVVYSVDGSRNPGAHEFQWNGETNSGQPALPGTYEIQVDALDANQDPITTSTVVTGLVRGTETQNGQIFLLVGDRAVPVGSVLNTNQPSTNGGTNDALTTALSYVGLDVSYVNNKINHKSGTPNNIVYNLDSEAEQAKLIVTNENGETVYIGDVDKDAGNNITTWNGQKSDGSQAPDGLYTFTIDALDSSDKRIGFSSQAEGRVTGVETQNGQIFLNIGEIPVNLNNIISAAVPQAVA